MFKKCRDLVEKNPGKCFVVCGPTGSGKSSLTLDLARVYPIDIINADSRQVYRDFPILSDIPSGSERMLAPHFLYAHKSAGDRYTSFDWCRDAADVVRDTLADGRIPFIVGGTGFYIRNLVDGYVDVPVRECDLSMFEAPEIYNIVRQYGVDISQNDRYRITRNAQLLLTTGNSMSWWSARPKTHLLSDIEFITIYIRPSKNMIRERCSRRIDAMFPDVLREVQDFTPRTHAIIGFNEIMMYHREDISLECAKELILIKTMQYAKRQKTWFDHQMRADLIVG